MSHDTEERCAKFEEKPIFCITNDKNLVNLDLSIKNSKICEWHEEFEKFEGLKSVKFGNFTG